MMKAQNHPGFRMQFFSDTTLDHTIGLDRFGHAEEAGHIGAEGIIVFASIAPCDPRAVAVDGAHDLLQLLVDVAESPLFLRGILAHFEGGDGDSAGVGGLAGSVENLVLPEDQAHERAIEKFGLPLFVKPTSLGSSIGISRVSQASGLQVAVELARRYGDHVIIEAEIVGSEYFSGVIDRVTMPLIRVETPNEFYDYEAKYLADDTRYRIPCGLAPQDEVRLQHLALEAFRVVGCRTWGRVDIMQDSDGKFWLLEVNTVPGMTDHSLVPMAAKAAGISFEELVVRILKDSLEDANA